MNKLPTTSDAASLLFEASKVNYGRKNKQHSSCCSCRLFAFLMEISDHHQKQVTAQSVGHQVSAGTIPARHEELVDLIRKAEKEGYRKSEEKNQPWRKPGRRPQSKIQQYGENPVFYCVGDLVGMRE